MVTVNKNAGTIGRLFEDNFEALKRKVTFGTKAQVKFLTTLERLTRNLTLAKSVQHMRRTANASQIEILIDMEAAAQSGHSYFIGAEKWFPSEIHAGLMAGEKSGEVNEVIKSTLEILEGVSSKVFAPFYKLIYPCVILAALFAASKYIDQSLLSKVEAKIVAMDSVPDEITIIRAAAYIYEVWSPFILAGFLALFFGLKFFLKNYAGPERDVLDRYPVFNQYKQICAISFLQLYENLLRFKMLNLEAITVIYGCYRSNPYLRSHIERMIPLFKRGVKLPDRLDTGLIDVNDLMTFGVIAQAKGDSYIEAVEGALGDAKERLFENLNRLVWYLLFFVGGLSGILLLSIISIVFGFDQYFGV